MPRYLLDTNVLSHLVRKPSDIAHKVAAVGEKQICTSIVVACELRFGARKKGSDVLTARVDQLLGALEVMPLDGDVDRVYAEIRDSLESHGQPIGGNDYLIAAHALTQDCVLVTENVEEFRRVPNLAVESWLPTSGSRA
jgi:tRNA(fMet)-specific endonuclease VapC